MQRLTSRLAGAVVAAALIVIGLGLATRPVGDEGPRAHATAHAIGYVTTVQTFWSSRYLVTFSWGDARNLQVFTRFLLPESSPPWSEPNAQLDLLVDSHHPASVVLSDPSWSENSPFRVEAAFQSVVPFTMAVLALALFVIWPGRPPEVFSLRTIRQARRGLRRFLLTPTVICALAVLAPVVIQSQPVLAYSPDAVGVAGWFSALQVVLVIWLCVRATRFARLRRRLTIVDDPIDGAAVIRSVAGRCVWVDYGLELQTAAPPDGQTACLQLAALRGQRQDLFAVGDRVRLYIRGNESGPALLANGDRVLLGRGRRRRRLIGPDAWPEPAADVGGVLGRRYPVTRRSLWRYLFGTTVIALVESGGSVALVVTLFGNVPGDRGDALAWVVFVTFTWATIWWPLTLYRWRRLGLLVRGPYATRHGVMVAVRRSMLGSTFGATVATIDVPGEPAVRIRFLGGQQLSWLSAGHDVVLMEQDPGKTRPAVLAGPGGQAAVGIARHSVPESQLDAHADQATDSLLQQYPRLRRSLRLYRLRWIGVLIVAGGWIATVISAGLNPGWLNCLWSLYPALIIFPKNYTDLRRLLRGPYVTQHGVLLTTTSSGLQAALRVSGGTIEVPDEPDVRILTFPWQRATWLAQGSEAVLVRRAGAEIPADNAQAAFLVSLDGQTLLVAAKRAARVTEPIDSQ